MTQVGCHGCVAQGFNMSYLPACSDSGTMNVSQVLYSSSNGENDTMHTGGGGGNTLQVTVDEGVYFFDGMRTPEPALPPGQQFYLNVSDPTVDGHPMLISEGPDGTHAGHHVLNGSMAIVYLVDHIVVSQDTYMNSFDSSHADYSHRRIVALTTPPAHGLPPLPKADIL